MTVETPESVETPQGAENGGNEPRTYSQEEFDAIKTESIENRIKAKNVDTLREALQVAYLEKGSAGVLVDATDLAWSDEFNGEDGMPDVDKIKAAAEALAETKPHLARVRGDAGQGYRGPASAPVDLAALLRG